MAEAPAPAPIRHEEPAATFERGRDPDVRETVRAQQARLDREAEANGHGPIERTLRGIDAASNHLANDHPDLAAALYDEEVRRIRADLPNRRGAENTTLELISKDLENRARLYRATDSRSVREAAGGLAFHANQSLRVADMLEKDFPDHAKVLRATGTDGMVQAQAMHAKAVEADAAVGKSFSQVYRNIVDASFAKKIDEAGSLNNLFTGKRDKLEEDRKKMGVVFDHIDKMIEREGIPFHQAWSQMFNDSRIPNRGVLPGFATAKDAATFLRDHDVSKGLLSPMSRISEGIDQQDPAKMDRGRADLIQALRANGQWGIAKQVLDDFKASASTAGGVKDAKRLDDNEWKERWTAKGVAFASEELPVLLLTGVLSGGAGTLARAGAVGLNLGSKARTAAVVGTELSTFVVGERILNDAINGKKADWSSGAIGRDLAFGAAGYGILKGAGMGWRALRDKAPELGRFGQFTRGQPAASAATREVAEKTADRLRGALAAEWRFPGVQPSRVNKVREEARVLLDEVDQARRLLESGGASGATRARLERTLADADGVLGRLETYSRLEPPRLPTGRAATEAEQAAHRTAMEAFRAEEAALRRTLDGELRRASEELFKLQAPLAGVSIRPVGPEAGAPFARDPIALSQAHRARHGLEASRNVGYGELTVGSGRPNSLGVAASGSDQAALATRTGRYANEARPLHQQPGQHTGGRANDSEVQLLEAAAKALEANPNASGVLRIFTERPPCASCRRVMARFLAEHPNITLEVFHNARHIPSVVGVGAGVESGRPRDR